MSYYRIQTSKTLSLGTDHQSYEWSGCEAPRSGVSCCRSLSDLVRYFVGGPCQGLSWGRALRSEGCYIVEFDGDLSDDQDHDHRAPGAPVLVHPTEIISVVDAAEFMAELTETIRIEADVETIHYAGNGEWQTLVVDCWGDEEWQTI